MKLLSGGAALLFLSVACKSSAIRITSIKPTEGGVAGGTRITITGAGFSEDGGGGGNRVSISIQAASSPSCDVIGYLSSYDQIVCITRPPHPSCLSRK